MIKQLLGNLQSLAAEPERSDQGKQTEPGCVRERVGPFVFRFIGQSTLPNGESMMKMRGGGNVPGVAGQGACEKTAHVIDKMDDDHFDYLQG